MIAAIYARTSEGRATCAKHWETFNDRWRSASRGP